MGRDKRRRDGQWNMLGGILLFLSFSILQQDWRFRVLGICLKPLPKFVFFFLLTY